MKRLLPALAVLLALLCAGSGVARAETVQAGDLNGDGAVTAGDAAKTLRAACGTETLNAAESAMADVTGNMEVGGADATAILLLVTGRLNSFSDLSVLSPDSLLGEKHLEQFSYLGIILKNNGYRSDRVSVSVSQHTQGEFVYDLADIYVQSIESMHTAFGGGAYLAGREETQKIAADNGAILAINGDGYSNRKLGPLVRNGVWYRESVDPDYDLCVLYRDGSLVTYDAGSVSLETLQENDVYQTWTGGPRLLDDTGEPLEAFHCARSLNSHSARTVIGYYEPGHYCFVTVDGTQNPASTGATLDDLAELLASLGCKAAYCLFGGNSSVMTTQTQVINTVKNGGRTVSDIVYLCEPVGTNGGE